MTNCPKDSVTASEMKENQHEAKFEIPEIRFTTYDLDIIGHPAEENLFMDGRLPICSTEQGFGRSSDHSTSIDIH